MHINNNNNTHNPASPNLNLSEARGTLKASVVLVKLGIHISVPCAHKKVKTLFHRWHWAGWMWAGTQNVKICFCPLSSNTSTLQLFREYTKALLRDIISL